MKNNIYNSEELRNMPEKDLENIIGIMAIIHLDYIRRHNNKKENKTISEKNAIEEFKNKIRSIIKGESKDEFLQCIMPEKIPVGYAISKLEGKYAEIEEVHTVRPEIYQRIQGSSQIFSKELVKRNGRRAYLLSETEKMLKEKGAKGFLINILATNNNSSEYNFYEKTCGYGILSMPVKFKNGKGNKITGFVNAEKGDIDPEDIILEIPENRIDETRKCDDDNIQEL